MASSEQQSINSSQLIVDKNEEQSRLDRLICRRLGQEKRNLVLRLIRKGNVRLNGKRAKPDSRVSLGDIIYLPASLRNDATASATEASHKPNSNYTLQHLAILYEDEDLLIIDKAPGMVVHGGSGHEMGLIEILKSQMGLNELRLAHRLDRDTSGCLLLAKNLACLRKLTESFRLREAHKTYFAWVSGSPYPCAGRLISHLRKGVTQSGERMVVDDSDGQEAITDLQTVMVQHHPQGTCALVALNPHSGRTHQLRVQLQQEGHAILGDPKYAERDAIKAYKARGGKGLALHAWRLRFVHPVTQRVMDVRAPWPKRWAHFKASNHSNH